MRPLVLTIAGLDPSAGAGLTADLKTFERHDTYGMSVCTALTIQNESEFRNLRWLSLGEIQRQLDVLLDRHRFSAVKIGLIKGPDVLHELIVTLLRVRPETPIVLDPVLKASAGFAFRSPSGSRRFLKDLKGIGLLTPNREEVTALAGTDDPREAAAGLSFQFPVLLKGGHDPLRPGVDQLYNNGHLQEEFLPDQLKVYPKHGSGCVLSAAIAANLAGGIELKEACRRAKRYTETFLASTPTLLGYHNIERIEQ